MGSEAENIMESLLRDTREDIGRADAKASMLFGIAGVVLGVLLAGVLAGDWSPIRDLKDGEALWWIGCACALSGMVCLGLAVYPQIGHPASHKDKVAYFGHVASFDSVEDFQRAVKKFAENGGDGARTVDQVFQLSKIVMRKYRLVRAALFLLAAAGCFVLVGIAAG